MKVVAYLRCSRPEQAQEGVTLEVQRAKVEQYAALYGHELVAVIEDAGESAKSLKRPGLAQALQLLDSGAAQGFIVAKLDRLTRSVKDLGTLLERYFSSKFSLFSVGDQIDTTSAAGRLVLNILVSVAQWEREAIGERTKAALELKRAQGVQLGGPRYAASIAQRIQQMAASGMSQRRIAATLNSEKVATLRGGPWLQGTVSKLLARA